MPQVTATAEAVEELRRMLEERCPDNPGVVVHRTEVKADLVRGNDGEPHWSIERPYPWQFSVTSLDVAVDPEQIVNAYGLRFGFATLDMRKIKHVHFSVGPTGVEVRVDA